MKKHKLAFIGRPEIHAALSKLDPDWDFQAPAPTIKDFKEMLDDDDSELITYDTKVAIIFIELFKNDKKEFADLVTWLNQGIVVCILSHPNYETTKPLIDTEIEKSKEEQILEDDEFNTFAPYYYLDYYNIQADLIEAITQFSNDSNVDIETRDEIAELIPEAAYVNTYENIKEENTIDDEDDFYEDSNDEIILPNAGSNATGRVVSVTSSKGGSGKSTVSIVLGAYLAKASQDSFKRGYEKRPLRVCIVDLDVRDAQLNLLNGASGNTPNVFDIFESFDGKRITEQNINQGIYTSEKLSVDFIFALQRPRFAKSIHENFYAQLIQKLRGMYDYIILDTSVNYLDPLLEKVAYPLSDKVICVTDMGISSIVGMARWIREVTTPIEDGGSGVDKDKIGIVVNKVMSNIGMPIQKIEKATFGREILGVLPSVPDYITYAANTASLELILNKREINLAFQSLAETIAEDSGYKLGNVPYKR